MFEVKITFANEAEYLGFASALYLGRATQAAQQEDSAGDTPAAQDEGSPAEQVAADKPAKTTRAKRTRKGKSTKKPAATEAAPEAAPTAAPAGAEPAEEMTLEKLRGIVRAYAQEHGTDDITKALAKFGVKRLPDLGAEQMAALATALSA